MTRKEKQTMNNAIKEPTPESKDFQSSSGTADTIPPPASHKMLDQAMAGLVYSLKEHAGNMLRVQTGEILTGSDIREDTLDFYYPTPFSILKDAQNVASIFITHVEGLVTSADKAMPSLDSALTLLLDGLTAKPDLLRILALTRDFRFWQEHLIFLRQKYAVSWHALPASHQTFLYHCFCFLLMEVLWKWEQADFNPDYKATCIRLIKAPLLTPSIFSTVIEDAFILQ